VTIAALKANDIAISQGSVSFRESGHVSVFVRDPDCNVIELRQPERGRGRHPLRAVTPRRGAFPFPCTCHNWRETRIAHPSGLRSPHGTFLGRAATGRSSDWCRARWGLTSMLM
jgi:hypothetical protein